MSNVRCRFAGFPEESATFVAVWAFPHDTLQWDVCLIADLDRQKAAAFTEAALLDALFRNDQEIEIIRNSSCQRTPVARRAQSAVAEEFRLKLTA